MNLYPDQERVVRDVAAAFRAGHRCVVMQCPTGFGKTAAASWMIRRRVAAGDACTFLAHLDALIDDTGKRLAAAGLHVGIVQGDKAADPAAPVQVGSFQTYHARGLSPTGRFVLIDEAHRVMGTSVRGILERAAPDARILLLTATPQRGDGQPLGDVASAMVQGPSVRELTALGRLVPSDVIAPPTFEERGLTTTPLAAYQRHTPGARAIVFCANVAHARETAAAFEAAGLPAACLVGNTPRAERLDIRERLERGQLRALVGVGVFLEGFDAPCVDAVILARSFSVCGGFLQAIGRGLRTYPGKERCTVLDLRGSVHLHGLPDEDRCWSLEGGAVRRVERLTALQRCKHCLAIFRPATVCPRCQLPTVGAASIPRDLSKPERLERLSHLPQHARDARYLASLRRVASERMRMPDWKAARWAAAKFEKQFGRKPEVAA